MATRFRLLSGTQHSNNSEQRRSDSSSVGSTHASMRLYCGTMIHLLVVLLQVWMCGVCDRSWHVAT